MNKLQQSHERQFQHLHKLLPSVHEAGVVKVQAFVGFDVGAVESEGDVHGVVVRLVQHSNGIMNFGSPNSNQIKPIQPIQPI